MKTEDFNYDLPETSIAQFPAEPRDSCRLLVLHRADGRLEHKHFYDIVEYLNPGDLVVVNHTRVLPARLVGRKRGTGGVCETLLLTRREDLDPTGSIWECLVQPGRRLKPEACIEFCPGGLHAPEGAPCILTAEILDFVEGSRGARIVRFSIPSNQKATYKTLDDAFHAVGHLPLPPYITSYEGDPEKYQTVYATDQERSAAAPTAGLHFTPELIERIKAKGVQWMTVELEVGIDTFRVVDEENVDDHTMHTERYHVSQEVIDAIYATKAAGNRVVAIGTTSVRSLESAWEPEPSEQSLSARFFEEQTSSCSGSLHERKAAQTNLFIYPGKPFHVVDAMVTNFHVPRSTLMMLVSAFAGREYIMEAYQEAIDEGYRFLSFGDAMLML